MTGSDLRQRFETASVLGAVGVVVYLLAPAAAASPFGAWPLTPLGAAVLAAAIGAGFLAWRVPGPAGKARWMVAAIAALIAIRATASITAGEEGWLARYYANDAWSGRPEWSSEFRFSDATRVDRAIAFSAGQFPVHFLNGPRFSNGPPDRDIATPLSVQWSAVFRLAAEETISVSSQVAGSVTVAVDGSTLLSTEMSASREVALAAGQHSIDVRYRKPADVSGSLTVDLRRASDNGPIVVAPSSASARRPLVDLVAIGADAAMLLLLIGSAALTLGRLRGAAARLQLGLGALVVAALGLQGFVAALPFTRFYTLTAGDDWLGFESRARNILEQGLLMPLDAALGDGVPYFYHPFYSYLLAAVHALTGESLFGPIFVHFLILAATAIVMYSLARPLFGSRPAMCGVAALVAIFELDFIRRYTITLLSENLYVLTVSCCLLALARWVQQGRTAMLALAGVWGGISAATRPVMMVFLPLAFSVVAVIARRSQRGAIAAPFVLAGAWMACVLPFTMRNWIVSRQLVLISAGQGGAVIEHNVPRPLDPGPYLDAYRSGEASSVGVLWRIFVEHPAAFIGLQFKKLGFSLGMVHWFEGYRPHPELIAITVLYVAMLVTSRAMRRPELWPVHAFVFSHFASMLLTQPWNYGYRLILPAYVYTTVLSVAAAAGMLRTWRVAER